MMEHDSKHSGGGGTAGTGEPKADVLSSPRNASSSSPARRRQDRLDVFSVLLIAGAYLTSAIWSWSIATREAGSFNGPLLVDPLADPLRFIGSIVMILQRIENAGLIGNTLSLLAGCAILYGCTAMAKWTAARLYPAAGEARPLSFTSQFFRLDTAWLIGAGLASLVLMVLDRALPYGWRMGVDMLLSLIP